MSALYLVLLPDGTHDGPFTEEDLLDLVDADEIGAGTICEHLETKARCRIRDLFKVIPPLPQPHPDPTSLPPWVPAPLPPQPPPAPPLPPPQRTVYLGHPSLWLYWRSLLLAACLLSAAWYAGTWPGGGWWLAIGWLLGGSSLALTLLRRASIEYLITTRRIEIQRGLLSKSSQEIRLPDIRAIHLHTSGLRGLLGIGDLTFASAANAAEDLVFRQTPRAHALKQQVRRLQDRAL